MAEVGPLTRSSALGAIASIGLLGTGCAQLSDALYRVWQLPNSFVSEAKEEAPAKPPPTQCEERIVYKHRFSERVVLEQAERKASVARIAQLESEIQRFKSDLDQAEKTLIIAESSLTGAHTRAQAVRAIAEARTQIEKAERDAPWRKAEAQDGRRKVEEADRHLRAKRFGASILFASRAKRIARGLAAEARSVRISKKAKQTGSRPVRLRARASSKSKLIATLQPRTPVFLEKVHGHWVLVRTLSSKVGWVPKSALVALPASPAPLP